MKAIVFRRGQFEIEEVDRPQVGAGEALIRVKACAICSSDVKFYHSLIESGDTEAHILGHEFAGEIAEVSEGNQGFAPGDPVVVDPIQHCGYCAECEKGRTNLCRNAQVIGFTLDGAFAEYIKARISSLHRLPQGVSFVEAALSEPLASACHTISRLRVSPGETAAVIGPGPIGLLMSTVLKLRGAYVIMIGTRKSRLEAAERIGADCIINSLEKDPLREAEKTTGKVDVAIDAVGSPKTEALALELIGRGGRVGLFGAPRAEERLQVNPLELILKDQELIAINSAPATFFVQAINLIDKKLVNLEPIITHVVPSKDFKKALSVLEERQEDVIKVVVKS
ncbi:MAG: alcohol dehydrogenase catalytic domain-containing protein [Candidatus Latescibacteria bacterium]|nr:alcohol dehydrogenase catalytic domain-containing protein [Candidatus Latescibacterota bacterium]